MELMAEDVSVKGRYPGMELVLLGSFEYWLYVPPYRYSLI
jgi:hypothetical protein